MGEMREHKSRYADLTDVRGRLLGAALVAFGVIAFGAYSFAISGDHPLPRASKNVSTDEVRTTPDNVGQQDMPPPVAKTKTP